MTYIRADNNGLDTTKKKKLNRRSGNIPQKTCNSEERRI